MVQWRKSVRTGAGLLPRPVTEGTTIAIEENGKFGGYRLREQISRGGIATIWLATDAKDNLFAIRIMHNDFRANSSGPSLFRAGCEILKKIPRHENIIHYLNHGREAGRDYMLLEYVEGANLRELMIKSDPQVQDNLGDRLLDMASALAHVHSSEFMHLDFKPENLVVSRGGRMLLCDFDTAQPIPTSPIRLPNKSGTPLYMPPEIINGWGCDQRADIYSFAVTAYELLTRIKPFEGRTPQEMLRNQLNPKYRIRKLRDFNDGIPIVLENMILKCLSHLPENRYPFMAHITRDLHKALGVR